MKKFYQTEWFGIPFISFTKPSSKKLADSTFYSSFYKIFFQRHKNWEDLQPDWVQLKLQVAQFIQGRCHHGKTDNILSIGCGLGIIEKTLRERDYLNLEITEVSKESLQWLLPYIAPENIHIGFFPNCLPANRLYDFIYLSSVEYFFDKDQLIDFLKAVRERLIPGGICLVISWSFESIKPIQNLYGCIKDLIKYLLDRIGLIKLGQFWGYIRNRKDFYNSMDSAGFVKISDGFLEKKTRWDTYWIEGVN